MSFDEVETIADCIEMATVDAYGDDELLGGWQTCLDEILSNSDFMVLGDKVKLTRIHLSNRQVVAVCTKGKSAIKVTLDSIKLIKPSAVQLLWLKAWNKWSKGYV